MIHFPRKTPGCIDPNHDRSPNVYSCCWLCMIRLSCCWLCMIRLHWMAAKIMHEDSKRKCRVCGCTELRGCLVEGGPGEDIISTCYWVEPDLCSACAGPGHRYGSLGEESEYPYGKE